MRIYEEVCTIRDLDVWSGGQTTVDAVIDEQKEDELFELLEDHFPNGATKTEVNDFLWFESDYIYRELGIDTEEDDEDW